MAPSPRLRLWAVLGVLNAALPAAGSIDSRGLGSGPLRPRSQRQRRRDARRRNQRVTR